MSTLMKYDTGFILTFENMRKGGKRREERGGWRGVGKMEDRR